MNLMKAKLEELSKKYNFVYIDIESTKCLLLVYRLLTENIMPSLINDNIFYYYLGIYYGMNKDFINMEKYYKLSADMGNKVAMYYLSMYYYDHQDYDNMFEYTMKGITDGSLENKFTNLSVV
jgi:hypothetical protein